MLFTSVKMSLMVLWPIPLIVFPIIILGRKVRGLSKENQDWIAQSSGDASEQLLSVQTVQAFTHESQSRGNFKPRNRAELSGGAQTYCNPCNSDRDRYFYGV